MRTITLNGITRSYINQSRKTIHSYARFLKYANDILRELLFDRLQITNTVRLPVNEFYEAEIPADCVDWCKVGIQVGQFVRPLLQKNTLNNLADFDTDTGEQQNYPDETTSEVIGGTIQWAGHNLNTNGESTGGYFGIGAGSEPDTFKIIEARNIIQLNKYVGVDKIVFEYITDGSYTNAATKIPVYAQKCIESYIDWQYKEHSKSFGAYDAERAKKIFDRQVEVLAARKNDLTPDLVERIINRNRKATIK